MAETTLILSIINLTISSFTFIVFFFWSGAHRQITNKTKLFKFGKGKEAISDSEYESFTSQLAIALHWLSNNRIGSLIVVEHKQNLDKYVQLGYPVQAKFNPEFLINIFHNKASALHDGGIIIRGLNIVSISSYFPITNLKLETSHGARHRAAIGISEQTDAYAFVVSETNGNISIAKNGKLVEIDNQNVSDISAAIHKKLNYYINKQYA